ncbi:Chloroperoxidase [Lasiosphaeria ovina]|uniref:Chloroperoxidase n=1 Tax=Lasiosphaeria ovina TaxID=92902 RepID=A0AAE0N4Q7_9PEZI|nr:Chloroperoxidase [Lasiosphaeria ovina]
MQLSIFHALRSYLPFGSRERDEEAAKIQAEKDHGYVRGDISARGPCPAMNALANQGYLPRDGKNISIARAEAALMTALHMDSVLAHTLASQLKPFLHAKTNTFDLVDMRRHGVVERDVSFTRLDFRHGDNYTFQPSMFAAMQADAARVNGDDGATTVRSLAATYRRREREEKSDSPPSAGLSWRLYFVSLVQTVSFLHTADVGGRLDRDVLAEFYTLERFPDVVLENQSTRHLTGLVANTLQLAYYLWFGGVK